MTLFRRSALRARPRSHEPDWWLLATVLTLALFGTVMVFSSATGLTAGDELGADSYLVRQLVFLVVGIGVMLVAMHIDYHRWRPLAVPALLGVLVLLGGVLLVAPDINGSHRWFDLGLIQLQPSELAKPILIVYLASWLCSKGAQVKDFYHGMFQFVILMGGLIGLVLLEPDLGTSVLLATVGAAMFFVGGASIRQFAGLIFATGSAFVFMALSAPYRRARVLAFLDPESNLETTGWHLLQARFALGDGGLFGVGLGASRQKFSWLPAPHNDAIFAVIGEELGLIGAAFVLLLFGMLAYRGYRIARRAPDQFGAHIAVGVTTWFAFQALFNIGGVTASIPFTGITLPFISYGGSSLMVSFAALGLLMNVSRQTQDVQASVNAPYVSGQTQEVAQQPAPSMMAAARTGNVPQITTEFEPVSTPTPTWQQERRHLRRRDFYDR